MTTHIRATAPAPPREARGPAHWLALCAAAGPVLLTTAWSVLGLMRPEVKTEWGVSGGFTGMITQPFSGLGLGTNGFLMNGAFVVSGLLMLAGFYGIFQTLGEGGPPKLRTASWALLSVSGVGCVLAGVFTLKSLSIHMLGFVMGCGTPIASLLVAGLYFRQLPGRRGLGNWLIACSPLTLVLFALYFATFRYDLVQAASGMAGLTERLLVTEVFAPFVAMAWIAFRTPLGASRR